MAPTFRKMALASLVVSAAGSRRRRQSAAGRETRPGDSHQFVADDPLDLPNFTWIVVHGETLPFDYLRLSVGPRAARLFSWGRVQVPAH